MNLEAPIQDLLQANAAAVHAKDVDAFLALYEDDVVVVDTWRWLYCGTGAWRANVTEWFSALGDERVGVEWDDVHSVTGDGVAAVYAVVTYRGLSSGGAELRSMQNRLTRAVRRRNGSWRIAHEHTSALGDFETMKVSLRRAADESHAPSASCPT